VLRDRLLDLLAFDARLADMPPALLEALWEAIDRLPTRTRLVFSECAELDNARVIQLKEV